MVQTFRLQQQVRMFLVQSILVESAILQYYNNHL
jgi:hypothetical protein